MSMGVREKLAVQCRSSNKAAMDGGHIDNAGVVINKSYWRSTKTAGVHIALNNEFFANLGLISLRGR